LEQSSGVRNVSIDHGSSKWRWATRRNQQDLLRWKQCVCEELNKAGDLVTRKALSSDERRGGHAIPSEVVEQLCQATVVDCLYPTPIGYLSVRTIELPKVESPDDVSTLGLVSTEHGPDFY